MILTEKQTEELKLILENLNINLNGKNLLTKVEMEAMQRILNRILTSNDNKTDCVHKWKYLCGTPQNETHKCIKCGVTG